MDVRRVVARWLEHEQNEARKKAGGTVTTVFIRLKERIPILDQVSFASPSGTFLPITRQLQLLGLGSFEGRQHCGMDVRIAYSLAQFGLSHLITWQDTRNVARIVVELARRGMPLRANTSINPYRRWPWMGKNGKILEQHVAPATPAL